MQQTNSRTVTHTVTALVQTIVEETWKVTVPEGVTLTPGQVEGHIMAHNHGETEGLIEGVTVHFMGDAPVSTDDFSRSVWL